MGLAIAGKKAMLLIMMMIIVVLCGLSMAIDYNVGGSAGWTIPVSDLDYKDWAASRKFFVGDTLVFNYNKQYHNVMQVKVEDFKSCNTESPIARYGKGSDAIRLDSSGEYYFICGYPGHCQPGQKLHITVNSAASPPSHAPSTLPPNNNSVAPSLYSSNLSYLAMVVAVLAYYVTC
ncbi:hypothetical protein REPUB_Repub13aG0153800 [Reevesia pubescens]